MISLETLSLYPPLILSTPVTSCPNFDKFSDPQGRKELIGKLRKEMNKGLEKEYMLNTEDRVLVYKFFNKLKNEINSVEEN